MLRSDNKFKQVVKKKVPVRPDALFWTGHLERRPKYSRQFGKLMRHTEYVRPEGNGFLLRVTKKMEVFKRGVYYIHRDFNNAVSRNDALVRATIKPGAFIFFYPAQGHGRTTALKLRADNAHIDAVCDLNDTQKKLGFAVSFYAKDLTNEQSAYIPGKSLRLRMRRFKDECGSGFHFYLFRSEVNRLYKHKF